MIAVDTNLLVRLLVNDHPEQATDLFQQGPADFADCLLCAKAAAAGCDRVATFDRGTRTLRIVKLL